MKNLDAWFGTKQALKSINLDVKDKTATAFIGPSGCGKTTLIRCLNRMHEMTPGGKAAGQVVIDGTNIYDRNIEIRLAKTEERSTFRICTIGKGLLCP
ncbi:MAG: ATP-binding cassette domain-containing protein [Nitrososphaeraceae archaeon]|nr:ATP-binding cassette domain-containing protein [Nitrososphaeraceae archaeon]